MAGDRILHGAHNGRQCRLVEDVGGTAHGQPRRLRIADVPLDHLGLGRARGARTQGRLQILPATGGEVVEDGDPLAPSQEGLDDVGPDEPSSAGHQEAPRGHPHRPTPV